MKKFLLKGKKIKEEGGFSLIEFMVAMAVFTVLIVAVSQITHFVLKSQRKAFALQNVQESSRFILEMATKEIRTSSIEDLRLAGEELEIINSYGETIIYQFDNANKIFYRDGEALNNPSNFEITGTFYHNIASGSSRSSVTIALKISAVGDKPEEQAEMNLQSTVSSRIN